MAASVALTSTPQRTFHLENPSPTFSFPHESPSTQALFQQKIEVVKLMMVDLHHRENLLHERKIALHQSMMQSSTSSIWNISVIADEENSIALARQHFTRLLNELCPSSISKEDTKT